MECVNQDCKRRELLKTLFAGETNPEKLPEFCPFCGTNLIAVLPTDILSRTASKETEEEVKECKHLQSDDPHQEHHSSEVTKVSSSDTPLDKEQLVGSEIRVQDYSDRDKDVLQREKQVIEEEKMESDKSVLSAQDHHVRDVPRSTGCDKTINVTKDDENTEACKIKYPPKEDFGSCANTGKTDLQENKAGEDETLASMSDEKASFEEMLDKSKPSNDASQEKMASNELPDEKAPSNEKASFEEMLDKNKLSNNAPQEEMASNELPDQKAPSNEKASFEEMLDKNKPSNDTSQEKMASTELPDEKALSNEKASFEEMLDKNKPPNDTSQEKMASNELPDKKAPSNEVSSKVMTSKEVPGEKDSTKETSMELDDVVGRNDGPSILGTQVFGNNGESNWSNKSESHPRPAISNEKQITEPGINASKERSTDNNPSAIDEGYSESEPSSSEEEKEEMDTKSSIKPYDKEVIKQNRKKRKKKKRSGKGVKRRSAQVKNDEAKPEEKAQSTRNEEMETKGEPSKTSTEDASEHEEEHQDDRHSDQRNIPPPLKPSEDEDSVKIVFHALLAPDFKFNPKKQVVNIRLGHEELGDWKYNSANDFDISVLEDNFVSVHGEIQLHVRFLHKPIPYKYVVCSGKVVRYEYSEFALDHKWTIVNRSLSPLKSYQQPNAVWHQYDGVIYPPPPKNNSWNPFNWLKQGKFDQGEIQKNREKAANFFLPKWKGFVTNDVTSKEMTAMQAIERINLLQECQTHPYVSLGQHPQKKIIRDFEFDKILTKFLKPKITHNANLKEKELQNPGVRLNRLVSSLAITHLVQRFRLQLSNAELSDIIHCFVLASNSASGCDFYEIRVHFPENTFSGLVKSIINLLECLKSQQYSQTFPEIILAVPLIHFLRQDTKPFEKPEDTSANSVQKWCHVKDIPMCKPSKKFVEELLPKAQPMFSMDPYFRRLFLYYVPFENFAKISPNQCFPIDELCTALALKIKDESIISAKLSMIKESVKALTERMKELPDQRIQDTQEMLITTSSSHFLLQVLFEKRVKIQEEAFFTSLELAARMVLSMDQPDDVTSQEFHAIFISLLNIVYAGIEDNFSSRLSISFAQQEAELKVWTKLLDVEFLTEKLKDEWCQNIVKHFESRLKQLRPNDAIDLFCWMDKMDGINQVLIESITNHAFSEVEKMVEGVSSERSISALKEKTLNDGSSSKAGELLSRVILGAWNANMKNNNLTSETQLQYILTWKHWPGFISSFGTTQSQGILTPDAAKLLHSVVTHLCCTQRDLVQGLIDVKTITSLQQHQDSFRKLCAALTKTHKNTATEEDPGWIKPETAMKELEKRIHELDDFRHQKTLIGDFLNTCRSSKVPFEIADLEIKMDSDISSVPLVNICRRDPPSEGSKDGVITVVFFDLPQSLMPMLLQLSSVCKSKVFQNLWKETSKSAFKAKDDKEGELTLLEAQQNVWLPSIEAWEQLALDVRDGTISLRSIDKHFIKEDFTKEFEVMFSSLNLTRHEKDRVMNQRLKQVEQYQSLHDYIQASETIWKFKEALGLKGDFDVVAQLRDQTSEAFKEKQLDSINDRFLGAGDYLKKVSVEKAKCLDAVIKCELLVKWLRETIKDTSALSTLVDLAMISAGENDLEVDRISNFHTSCLNFAPLIFDVKEDMSFEDLMKICQSVWNAVDSDSRLPEKLSDTCRHLEWLKAVQSSHGSVEMSSLMQTKLINSSGVYQIGKITESGDIQTDLEGVITLTVPMDDRIQGHPQDMEDMEDDSGEKEEVKTYTLNDLKNLQSKLMLIAGKTAQLQNKDLIESTEEISQFVEILEGVMRLGQVYIGLCESGDVKYINWKKEINCHHERSFIHRSIAKDLDEICSEMESRLKSWRDHVHSKRLKFRNLNHFTTKQMLVLRRELGRLRYQVGASVHTLPQDVYALLESVHNGITNQHLIAVLSETSGFSIEALHCDPNISAPSVNDVFSSANLREKYQQFFTNVEKMNFEEDVGIAALKAMDITNKDVSETDLIDWCVEHGEDIEEVSFRVEEARSDLSFLDFFPESEFEIQEDEDENTSEMTLSDNEENESVEIDFEDPSYLSLDELGTILDKLAKKCLRPSERKFPEYLKHDQPNLVLVPSGDILATVLSLYMQYGEDRLPTPSEVLVCTSETTAEEVELFWWRAFEDMENQIFCLVNPDVLDYTVSQTAVNKFNVLKQRFAASKELYRIVVVCSAENEDRSHIVAALDEYRLQATPSCASCEILRDYLVKQLRLPKSLNGYYQDKWIEWTPAASLDQESLSVRVVSSDRAGVGKTLVVSRLKEQIPNLKNNVELTKMSGKAFSLDVTVPLHGTRADTQQILDALEQYRIRTTTPVSRIIHLDVSPSIIEGLETVLFNLVILGVLHDKTGRLWRRRPYDLCVIELTNSTEKAATTSSGPKKVSFISLLPTIECITPRKTLQTLKTPETSGTSPLFDSQEFRSVPIQRAYQYLQRYEAGQSLDRYKYLPSEVTRGAPVECLALMIKYCGIENPSWSELKHFVDFLNSQLHDCEESYFTNPENVDDQWMQGTLKGFKSFVVRFMVTMSRDFATPSLDDKHIVCSAGLSNQGNEDEDIRPLQLRRRWESSPHPYIFFNQDRITMTFLGFHINGNGDLIDPDRGVVIEGGLLTKQLQTGLTLQKVDFNTNYNGWTKAQRIEKLCLVMGLKYIMNFDPDLSYELTIDNMKKILAIHMRFRCGIPVVIMGETGCGKTRLIRYMCALQAGSTKKRNMLLMKVHGGTSYDDIKRKVKQAEDIASQNQKQHIDTVLFFDEANTTDALGMIKEVMVDRRINGRPVGVGLRRLHFIAACNPYRRHSDRMIKKLESAGLGYSVKANETKDKLGKIPLRHLVYRVHALPASMRPLAWDFGQLKPDIEKLYIKQIVSRYILSDAAIPGNTTLVEAIAQVLASAQKYMRGQQDECSFVSLRDVERAMTVMTWFYQHHDYLRPQDQERHDAGSEDEDSDVDMSDTENAQLIDKVTWSLLMSLGVCYHAKLQHRQEFRKCVVSVCKSPLTRNMREQDMYHEIERCQRVVINELTLGPNIARNTALSENVFMMVVCIELRIPLFVIGKPGSSKSLAKTVVADNMQGDASKSTLFKRFKRAHMVSYQCSPLSTPEGIVATFRQCRRLQDNNPDDRYASVVVLDEVGLAEDSPLLPLKTLHPLLEDGVTSSDDIIETDEKPTRVAFIGISNWALDPAKMNRGLMLTRGEPDQKELEDSARGICAEREDVRDILSSLLKKLAAGYAKLYEKQKTFESLSSSKRDEFFGLRDFYSLVKMVYSIAAEKEGSLNSVELAHAIRRNFGGLDEIDAVEIFSKYVRGEFSDMQRAESVNTVDLLRASLDHKNAIGESRYLLVITENYSALQIVEQQLIKNKDDYVVIFGSSFPKDQEYTQVCRNINQIKVCMETGRTVVLLNLENLYESLYDALNQYYVYCAGQKYVDLGLGSHRVKCRVDDSFRLIVIAERDVVYKKFPIPLINRLEKHYLVTSKSLGRSQLALVEELRYWAKIFAQVRLQLHERRHFTEFDIGDTFIGYQSDTIPSMVLQACNEQDGGVEDEVVKEKCQRLLLQCATPDAVTRLPRTSLRNHADDLKKIYFVEQEHSSLPSYLGQLLTSKVLAEEDQNGLLVQVTTHSRVLSEHDLIDICQATRFDRRDMELLYLQQFQTEQQFLKQIRDFFLKLSNHEGMVLVQCDSGDENFNLIACTRHLLMDQRSQRQELLMEKLQVEYVRPVHFVLIVQLPRQKGGCVNFVGFQGGQWNSVHVDDLRPPSNQIPAVEFLIDRPISDLLKPAWFVNESDVDMQNLSLEENDVDMESEEEIEIDVDMDESPSDPSAIFDAVVLLRRSVQAAAGRLEDDSSQASRTTERIDLILNLLPENSSRMKERPCFASSLHQKIYELLVEKNESFSGDRAREWVRNEALSGTRMHERGTFRRALQHKVLSEIEPLLAKILAFADRDCNLNLLTETQSSWLTSLWIRIFENKRLNEKYYELSNTNKIREHVHVSGRGRHVFRCLFPFSWLIKDVIDDVARGVADVSDRSGGTEEERLRRIIGNSELGKVLGVIEEEDKEEAVGRYLHDFMHMVYFPTPQCQKEEIELLSHFIKMVAKDQLDKEDDFVFDFASIHVTFHRVQSRINSFNQLVQSEPTIPKLLLEKKIPFAIDVAALLVCLEQLEAGLNGLRNDRKRTRWCNKVLAVRSSIEAMTSKESVNAGRYEDNEKDMLKDFWIRWQRLSVIRIFIVHMCTSLQNDVAMSYVDMLSKVLEDNSDFLTSRSVRSLETFLLECRQDFKNRIKICDTTCSICFCDAKLPVLTPCGHCFCYDCITHWCSDNQTCAKCREQLPAGFQPTESEEIKNAVNTLDNFRAQCISFFMEVASLFCFGYSPCGGLEEDTYELLMSYVTGEEGLHTKPFSPFSDTLDVTPVVRSFLLQQLLKSSDRKVREYMTLFINKAQSVVHVEIGAVEVFALCIQCMEDAKNSKFMKRAIDLPLAHKLSLIGNYCKTASTFWSDPQNDVLGIEDLEGITVTRCSLSLAADLMWNVVSQQDKQETVSWEIQRSYDSIFSDVETICANSTPRLFFLKQLSRKYGFDSISVLAKKFQWILPPDESESIEVSQDRFLVYGQEYQTLRETIAKSIVNGNMAAIEEALQNMRSGACVKNVTFLLGIFQEITLNPTIPISDQCMENLKQFIGNSSILNDKLKRLAEELTDEEEDVPESSIRNLFFLTRENAWETSMVEIIIHLAALLFSRDRDGLLGPLVSLAVRPSTCTDSFIPTMPEDRLEEVRAAVTSGKLYECPNGHPYLVTECGRPVETRRCRAPGCGVNIGGTNHVLVTNNRAARTTDQTVKGHCLGAPGSREQEPTPERDLSSLANCLVRLLVHGSMLIGSCYHSQDVAALISPTVPVHTVRKFFWDHVMTDMRLLSRGGRSVDETALMVHLLLQHISTCTPAPLGWNAVLQNKLQRRQWENDFSTTFIAPVMSNFMNRLQGTIQLIANDKRFGANPLLRQLYDLESGVQDYGTGIQTNCSVLWRYRTPITLDHVTRKFSEAADARSADLLILGEFIKQERELRAVRFLPEVVKLQNLLMDRFHRSLDKTETDKLKLRDFYKQVPKGSVPQYKKLVQSFKSAWEIMVTSIREKGTKGPLKKVSEHKISESSPISHFIPSTSGFGLCSLSLVQFLVRTNNEFLELCCKQSNLNLQHVSILEVTHSQIMSYEADRDLLPLVHAHCHYSLEVGQGTLVEYDWPAIQRHLIDRLIRGRSVVDFKDDEYTKTALVNAESVLTNLKAKIPQVELSSAIQHQIIHQYRSLQDVCEALSSLNTAITFLSSGGGAPNMPIAKYLHEVLKLPVTGLRNQKVQDVCQLQHSVSLWRLLSLERAKLLTRSDKDPFEHLPDEFKEKLEEKLKLRVNQTLRQLSETSVDAFVSLLMEFISLHLSDEYDLEHSLQDYMQYHIDSGQTMDVEKIPKDILLKHVFSFWKLILDFSDRCHAQRMQATG